MKIMKITKKIGAVMLALALCLPCFSIVSHAADGRISFTDPQTAVGQMVEIRCAIRTGGTALGKIDMQLTYDTAHLRFQSIVANTGDSVTAGDDGTLSYSGQGQGPEVTFTMTFQALAEGSGSVTVAGATVAAQDGRALTMDIGSSAVTIGPGDPSLIQPAPEAPAEPAAPEPAENDMQVEVNGVPYTLTDNFADADIPAGYTRAAYTVSGEERQMVVNGTESVYLGYLLNEQKEGAFFLYDTEAAAFYPYEEIAVSDTVSIVVLSDASAVDLPDTYAQTELTIDEKVFPVWQDMENDGFYVIYAINNSGEREYYRYDAVEGTYQRAVIEEQAAAPEKKEEEDSSPMGRLGALINGHLPVVLAAVLAAVLILLIIIIVLAVKLRGRGRELDDLYDEGIDMDEEPAVKSGSGVKHEPAAKSGGSGKHEPAAKAAGAKSSPGGKQIKDDDGFITEFEDLDDDIPDVFSEENVGKYDTMNIRRERPLDRMDDTDNLADLADLEKLLKEMSEQEKKPKKKSSDSGDDFGFDVIDLDDK